MLHRPQNQNGSKGVSMSEYALVLSLVTLLALASLTTMGGSISGFLSNTANAFSGGPLAALGLTKPAGNMPAAVLSPEELAKSTALGSGSGSGSSSTPGSENTGSSGSMDSTGSTSGSGIQKTNGNGYYTIAMDPKTGQPVMTLVDAPGMSTNVTSVDGQVHTLGTLRLAQELYDLSTQQSDPVLKNYYSEMAKWSYYLGGAEGEIDGVGPLSIKGYSKGDALGDIYLYHNKLQTLINNPPPGANPQQLMQAMPLAADVYNIAKNYLNTLDQFIEPNGKVISSFGTGYCGDSCGFSLGEPGSALTNANGLGATPDDFRSSTSDAAPYHQIMSFSEIKKSAYNVLSSYEVESAPVEATLTDASKLDGI